jgi:hypothetical protein
VIQKHSRGGPRTGRFFESGHLAILLILSIFSVNQVHQQARRAAITIEETNVLMSV